MTPAITYLEARGVPFTVLTYEHRKKGALFAAEALGLAPERTAKTLIVQLSGRGYQAVLMPGNKSLPFKELAGVYAVKRASMVDSATAERVTGYQVGGISPFGMRRSLPVSIDSSLTDHSAIAVNGGRRGIMLLMSPGDIVSVTGAEVIRLGG